MSNIIVIFYPYQDLNILYNIDIDDDLIEDDAVIKNELQNITSITPSLCTHMVTCDCIYILNIYKNNNLEDILLKYINSNTKLISIVCYNIEYKLKLKTIINNINNNITIIQLNNQKYLYDILTITCLIMQINISNSIKEIKIYTTSQT